MVVDSQKREILAKMEKDMLENLQVLERELSKLKAEREMTLAEMEELNATKRCVCTVFDARALTVIVQGGSRPGIHSGFAFFDQPL
jgi:hypothetical protein